MLPGDKQSAIPGDLFADPRVTRFWHNDRSLGTWFATHGFGDRPILYDAYLLFDKQAVWNDHPKTVAFSEPMLGDTDTLAKAIAT